VRVRACACDTGTHNRLPQCYHPLAWRRHTLLLCVAHTQGTTSPAARHLTQIWSEVKLDLWKAVSDRASMFSSTRWWCLTTRLHHSCPLITPSETDGRVCKETGCCVCMPPRHEACQRSAGHVPQSFVPAVCPAAAAAAAATMRVQTGASVAHQPAGVRTQGEPSPRPTPWTLDSGLNTNVAAAAAFEHRFEHHPPR
jgi:hypothetical protein